MTGEIFRGGVPVAPDVNRLLEAFGTPTVGTLIEHERVAEILGLRPGSHRYHTVTERWMAQLWDERNVRVVCRRGIGFEVLTASGRLDQGVRQMRKAARRAEQAVKETVTVPEAELSAAERQRRDHLLHANVLLLQAAKDAQRQYAKALPKPSERMPLPAPATESP